MFFQTLSRTGELVDSGSVQVVPPPPPRPPSEATVR
jgi:hypothetical protein